MVDISPVDIRRAAMDFLARREHSRQELVRKLLRKIPAATEDLVAAEVDKLRQQGLQSDARLAEALVRGRVGRGQGPLKIELELRDKGVDSDVIAVALKACGVDWFELVADVARKRFGNDKPADLREKARRARFLAQRGFSFEQIRTLD